MACWAASCRSRLSFESTIQRSTAATFEPLDVGDAVRSPPEDLQFGPNYEIASTQELDDRASETQVDIKLKRRVGARH